MLRIRRFVHDNTWLVAIVGLAFLVRVLWMLVAQPTPVSDWHAYRQLAADLLDHHQFGYPDRTTFYLPVHPVHLALWSLISRSDLWLALSSVVLSTASVGLIYAVGVRVHGNRRTALFAAALFAFLPIFILFSPVLATEHLFIVLMLSAMLLLLEAEGRGLLVTVLVGVFAGLAMLTRGEGVFYAPALIVYVWAGSGIPGVRRRVKSTLLIAMGIAIVVVPWYVRNATIGSADTGLSSGAGINFYFAHNDSGIYGWYPEGSPLEGLDAEQANRRGWELGIAYLKEHPADFISDIGFGTVELLKTPRYALFWSTRGLTPGEDPLDPASFVEQEVPFERLLEAALAVPVLLVLSGAALLALRSWQRPVWWLIVPLIGSSWILRTVLYWAKPRYGYFIHVMLVFIAAIALSSIVEANRRAPQMPTV